MRSPANNSLFVACKRTSDIGFFGLLEFKRVNTLHLYNDIFFQRRIDEKSAAYNTKPFSCLFHHFFSLYAYLLMYDSGGIDVRVQLRTYINLHLSHAYIRAIRIYERFSEWHVSD